MHQLSCIYPHRHDIHSVVKYTLNLIKVKKTKRTALVFGNYMT